MKKPRPKIKAMGKRIVLDRIDCNVATDGHTIRLDADYAWSKRKLFPGKIALALVAEILPKPRILASKGKRNGTR